MTTRRPLRAAEPMNEAATATEDLSKKLVEIIIEEIRKSGIAHNIAVAPFDNYTRLTCFTDEMRTDFGKIVVQIPKNQDSVIVRRSIDPGTDVVHPIHTVPVAGQNEADITKRVVDVMKSLKNAQTAVLKTDSPRFGA